jgi:hypothetical protein
MPMALSSKAAERRKAVKESQPKHALLSAWIAAASLCTHAQTLAHHGVAPHYDTSRTVLLDGTVAKFDFINPHAFVYVSVHDDNGEEQIWQCELASASVLARNGLTAETFRTGEMIRLLGVAGRQNPTGCAVRVAYFADGRELHSTTLFGPTLADTPPADPDSIIGTWTMKRFDVSRYEGALTDAGEAVRATFDPLRDDPGIDCDPASPVRLWINVNEPFEIKREADRVVIAHRYLDTVRTVYLDERDPPESVPRSTMGYSTGHFDGDALIVRTHHFLAGALEPRYGVMHTADLELTEKLYVDAQTGDLVITWTIDDPVYFREPFTQTELFVRSTRDLSPYDCKPGYQQ